ncbi:Cyclin-dependent kinase inhibitor 7 [Glycine soja]|uniref:Cyclin-dependent kinase inhibitor 7 n=1 Tax=Glycine soja TaxID=3848 RepID=A0A0B2S020_GLYSO|nr:Cyclin-dependent kinase inhibitor 7 [Glycine soja]
MGECKRCSLTIAAIEQPSSSQHSISKKRKTTASFQLRSSDTQFPDTTVSPEASVSSTGTVVSGDFCSDRSCCSSSHFKDLHSVPSDLQIEKKGQLLSEFSGDSEESAKSSAAVRKLKTPPQAEIEEFFAMAEKYERKRFTEKYNFDIVRDLPLEGRYQWVRLH